MTQILHLSTFIRRPIFDQDGDRIGRVQDLVARIGHDAHPPLVGVVLRIEGRNLFVPIRKIGGLAQGRMTFEGRRVDLRKFERRGVLEITQKNARTGALHWRIRPALNRIRAI